MAIRWRFSPSLWLLSTERRELYWCSSATKENHDLSIGGSSRPWKTAKNGEKRRETVIYLSIGGSLTRSIPDTVAVEPNRKVKMHACVLLKTHHTCSSHKGPTIHHRALPGLTSGDGGYSNLHATAKGGGGLGEGYTSEGG
ncbi:hypothetical protein Bca4012_095681 [Brassica carinata]